MLGGSVVLQILCLQLSAAQESVPAQLTQFVLSRRVEAQALIPRKEGPRGVAVT